MSEQLFSSANTCFVCGPDNPHGLRIAFRLDGPVCRAEYTPLEHYCGYAGVTHGGILFSLLDDVMANWLFLQGERAYTARAEVRYREPVATGTRLLLEGRQVSRRGRFATMSGRVYCADGRTVAEATATFAVIADEVV